MGFFLANLVRIALGAVWLLVIARVVLSWVDPAGRSPGARFVYSATEPILAPIRRFLPPTGALDLSPLIVLVVISLLMPVV